TNCPQPKKANRLTKIQFHQAVGKLFRTGVNSLGDLAACPEACEWISPGPLAPGGFGAADNGQAQKISRLAMTQAGAIRFINALPEMASAYNNCGLRAICRLAIVSI